MTLTNSTPLTARAQNGDVTDDDIDPAARRPDEDFTPDQKLAILAAYDEATEPGAKGALLRREGIYSSQITEWRKARDAGSLGGPRRQAEGRTQRRRARRPTGSAGRTNVSEAELAKTRTALDIMGKVHALLEGISKSADTEEK